VVLSVARNHLGARAWPSSPRAKRR
jgi:hypothetical protein